MEVQRNSLRRSGVQICSSAKYEDLVADIEDRREGFEREKSLSNLGSSSAHNASFNSLGVRSLPHDSISQLGSQGTVIHRHGKPQPYDRQAIDKRREYFRAKLRENDNLRYQIKERLERKKQDDDHQFQEDLKNISEGLPAVKRAEETVRLHALFKQQRKEQMHADWERQVHRPIYKALQKQIDRKGISTIKNDNISEYDKFIKVSNTKPTGLYLDIVLDDEYDPFARSKRCLSVSTIPLKDPAKRTVVKRYEELHQMDEGAATASLARAAMKSSSREVFTPINWSEEKIEATPQGRYSHERMQRLQMKYKKTMPSDVPAHGGKRSNVYFDHYTDPNQHDPWMGRTLGKRCMPQRASDPIAHDVPEIDSARSR